jgi:hypothetical protein
MVFLRNRLRAPPRQKRRRGYPEEDGIRERVHDMEQQQYPVVAGFSWHALLFFWLGRGRRASVSMTANIQRRGVRDEDRRARGGDATCRQPTAPSRAGTGTSGFY